MPELELIDKYQFPQNTIVQGRFQNLVDHNIFSFNANQGQLLRVLTEPKGNAGCCMDIQLSYQGESVYRLQDTGIFNPSIPKDLSDEKNREIETPYLELNDTGTYTLEIFKINWYNIPDDEWIYTPKDYLLYVSLK